MKCKRTENIDLTDFALDTWKDNQLRGETKQEYIDFHESMNEPGEEHRSPGIICSVEMLCRVLTISGDNDFKMFTAQALANVFSIASDDCNEENWTNDQEIVIEENGICYLIAEEPIDVTNDDDYELEIALENSSLSKDKLKNWCILTLVDKILIVP